MVGGAAFCWRVFFHRSCQAEWEAADVELQPFRHMSRCSLSGARANGVTTEQPRYFRFFLLKEKNDSRLALSLARTTEAENLSA